ncbi:MAG: hypothetical protein IIC82_08265 [Chloroflexi bacterium]|nr:hypothetical protein [Chloroflexota bacterium]
MDCCERVYPRGKAEFATAFVLRGREFLCEGGSAALVTPQNWLFLKSYQKLREELLVNVQWDWVVRLGAGAFETISGEVVNVALRCSRCGGASYADHDGGYACIVCARPIAVPAA